MFIKNIQNNLRILKYSSLLVVSLVWMGGQIQMGPLGWEGGLPAGKPADPLLEATPAVTATPPAAAQPAAVLIDLGDPRALRPISELPDLDGRLLEDEINQIRPQLVNAIEQNQLQNGPLSIKCEPNLGVIAKDKIFNPQMSVYFLRDTSCARRYVSQTVALYHVSDLPGISIPGLPKTSERDGILAFDYIPVNDPQLIEKLGRNFLLEVSLFGRYEFDQPGSVESLVSKFANREIEMSAFNRIDQPIKQSQINNAQILAGLGLYRQDKIKSMMDNLKNNQADPASQVDFLAQTEQVIWGGARVIPTL